MIPPLHVFVQDFQSDLQKHSGEPSLQPASKHFKSPTSRQSCNPEPHMPVPGQPDRLLPVHDQT